MMVFPGDNHLVPARAQRCGDRKERKYVAKATFGYNEDMRHDRSDAAMWLSRQAKKRLLFVNKK